MARSTYVYIIVAPNNLTVLSAYTVKKEMLKHFKALPFGYQVYRLRDGLLYPAENITSELEG